MIRVNRAAADYPGGAEGSDLTVEFTFLERPFLGLNDGPLFKPNDCVSHCVFTETQEETDKYWDALIANGGAASECGWCKDRWGYSWQITPRFLIESIKHPDPAVCKRVMQAMMTMQKIDIATLERAVAGESTA